MLETNYVLMVSRTVDVKKLGRTQHLLVKEKTMLDKFSQTKKVINLKGTSGVASLKLLTNRIINLSA